MKFENGTGDYEPIDRETLVVGNEECVRRVVDELLSNACKYSEEYEIYLRGGQRTLDSGKIEVLFEVEDKGIGIEEGALEQLFDPFTQKDSSHTRSYEGIGLGLAICRKLADFLGGSLTAESQPGVGSCFRFRCPLDLIESPQETEPLPRPATGSGASSAGKVLLVEDSPSNAIVAQTMLKRWGLLVDVAENGLSAVEKCRDQRYDLILMDLSMPVMNGFEATREIRSCDTPNRKTPILGLSAHVGSEVKEDCRNVEMDGFIAKPISMEAFRESISAYIEI